MFPSTLRAFSSKKDWIVNHEMHFGTKRFAAAVIHSSNGGSTRTADASASDA
jgi:hypothetical protein